MPTYVTSLALTWMGLHYKIDPFVTILSCSVSHGEKNAYYICALFPPPPPSGIPPIFFCGFKCFTFI